MPEGSSPKTGKLIGFSDKDGIQLWLSPSALHHIQHDHCIHDPVSFIQHVFDKTLAIVESKTKVGTRIYYSEHSKEKSLYKAVVANVHDQRIKTAFISDEIKGGGVIWISPSLMS
ncbi:MAG: hypothetical protein HY594_04465 [Candidatus Omnitrophica bacterium]|nr:hypothetical protein [Candidatus Omnitrophota bacterium]